MVKIIFLFFFLTFCNKVCSQFYFESDSKNQFKEKDSIAKCFNSVFLGDTIIIKDTTNMTLSHFEALKNVLQI